MIRLLSMLHNRRCCGAARGGDGDGPEVVRLRETVVVFHPPLPECFASLTYSRS
jgi:hypothetical protein